MYSYLLYVKDYNMIVVHILDLVFIPYTCAFELFGVVLKVEGQVQVDQWAALITSSGSSR